MSITLEKYTRQYFGEFLSDDSINEICYNGANKLWAQNARGIWESYATDLDFEKAGCFSAAAAAYKTDQID